MLLLRGLSCLFSLDPSGVLINFAGSLLRSVSSKTDLTKSKAVPHSRHITSHLRFSANSSHVENLSSTGFAFVSHPSAYFSRRLICRHRLYALGSFNKLSIQDILQESATVRIRHSRALDRNLKSQKNLRALVCFLRMLRRDVDCFFRLMCVCESFSSKVRTLLQIRLPRFVPIML